MGLRDGLSDNKLFDDFGPGRSNPARIYPVYIYTGKFYLTLSKIPCLYGSTPRSTKASMINVDKAPSQTLRLLDYSRTVGGSRQGIRNEEMVYRRDKIS
uniref:Ulp1 protease-like n=1 Tax=Oryza sativa subsp. japonica TaxID=39947 RepID=Q6K3W1_ORYSJ|nr:ulp1 protease-like [Oryza sativa Japonica Group]